MTTTSTPNPLRRNVGTAAANGRRGPGAEVVLLLVWPGVSILAASVLLGVYLVASGIAQVILAFGLELSGGYRVLWFITGALSLVLGCPGLPPLRPEGLRFCCWPSGSASGSIFQGVAATAIAISSDGAARTGRVHLLRRHQRDRRPCCDGVAVRFHRHARPLHRHHAGCHRYRAGRQLDWNAQRSQDRRKAIVTGDPRSDEQGSLTRRRPVCIMTKPETVDQ